MSDQKPMSKEDREAWLSMAGDDFLPWLQQEVGVAMAKLGLRDNLKDFMARLDKLEETGISEHVAMESMKRTADNLQILRGEVGGVHALLRKLEQRQGQTELAVAAMVKHVYQAPKIGEVPVSAASPQAPEPKVEEPAAPRGPVLTPKLQRVYDYVVKHQGQTQTEIGFALEHSKTTLCEMLSELTRLGLVTHDKVKTPNGGVTFRYFPTEGRKDVPRADETFLMKVVATCGKHPWSTAGELSDKFDWENKEPSLRTMSATLSNAVNHGLLRSHRESGDLTRYAPMTMAEPIKVEPTPVAPVQPKYVHSLHEQMVLKVLKVATEPQEVPSITGQIGLIFGAQVLNNSVNSVCIRLKKQGLLTSVPLKPGSRRKRYALVGQATSV